MEKNNILLIGTPFYENIFDFESDIARWVAKQNNIPVHLVELGINVEQYNAREVLGDAIFIGANFN